MTHARAFPLWGALNYFTKANAPQNSGERCVDCPAAGDCIYNAEKFYLELLRNGEKGWPINVLATQPTEESIFEAVKNGPYGRCVYKCDNDAVDHQVVNLEFEGGITAHLTMTAFSQSGYREVHIHGEKGEIYGSLLDNQLHCNIYGKENKIINVNTKMNNDFGHGGGDYFLVKDIIDDVVSDAVQNQWDYWHFLCELLRQEAEHRAEVRKYQRIRKAGFPQMKYIQELVLEDMPEDAKKLIPELGTLNFIKEGRNIVMYGNPGTGKTHTAIGLGIKACMEGYSVYFTTVPHLLTQIREAKNSRTLQLLEARFKKFDLVICDEMGYVSFDKEGAELLFSHLSLRAGLRSIIITTNLPFTRWEEIIKDKVLCSALVDRLCHKAFLMNMTGQSFRVRETKILAERLVK